MAQKEYLGGVSATTLAADMTSVATTFSVASGGGSSFPTGSSYPFVVVIGRGTSSEEKMLCSSRSGDSFTVQTRGYDGTSAVAHTGNPAVEHCIDALVVNEASELVSTATTAGDIVYWTAAETPARLGIGTAYQALITNSGATAPSWGASLQSLMTAAGDIVYASGANTPARLAKGTDGQVLTLSAGVPSWASGVAYVGAKAYRSTTQSIPNNTGTPVEFDAEDFDSDGFHDTGTNPSRFTVPAGLAGKYLATGSALWAAGGSGSRSLSFHVNGAAQRSVVKGDDPAAGATSASFDISEVLNLAEGDYVELVAFQDSGGSLSLSATNTYMSLTRMGS